MDSSEKPCYLIIRITLLFCYLVILLSELPCYFVILLSCYFVCDTVLLPCLSPVVEFVTPEFQIVNVSHSSFCSLVIFKSRSRFLFEELQVRSSAVLALPRCIQFSDSSTAQ